jgi:hypothetical protein
MCPDSRSCPLRNMYRRRAGVRPGMPAVRTRSWLDRIREVGLGNRRPRRWRAPQDNKSHLLNRFHLDRSNSDRHKRSQQDNRNRLADRFRLHRSNSENTEFGPTSSTKDHVVLDRRTSPQDRSTPRMGCPGSKVRGNRAAQVPHALQACDILRRLQGMHRSQPRR